MNTVGERIKQRRQALGYTQDRLATQASISKGFLSDVETGTRNPSAEYLLRIGDALEVSLDYLMKGGPLPSSEPPDRKVSIPAFPGSICHEARFTVRRGQGYPRSEATVRSKPQGHGR